MSKETKKAMPGKAERLALAKKNGTSELQVYLDLCDKLGRKPAKSAVARHKSLKDA